ncbi:MAG: pyrroline-5-carboxylate reductase [Xanthomonadales bacterium]|nr:pyrroline-5-carboxylate reductase [Gammaproteobacteria bacterium]NNE06667.1 pyrroline-5-carboxylate reductase [Xanthomonadales bacterium]NNL95514.1 pyrroline-5-carboxylate reductase [Xanthomonadales bacterium]
MNIAFIGGGNMAAALIAGLYGADNPPNRTRVSDPSPEARERLEAAYPVECFADAQAAVEGADVIVLATKPQVMPTVLEALAPLVERRQTVVSIAAGITIAAISRALGDDIPIVRTMPNTPALVGKGISGLYAGPACNDAHRKNAQRIMAAAGEVVWLDDEALMDVVTAVSGSGPAYYFLLTEALRDAGQAGGLPPATAAKLALHTARGAGEMAAQSELDVAELRRRVTSPGGTTQAALEALTEGGFNELVAKAVKAATERGRELSGEESGS